MKIIFSVLISLATIFQLSSQNAQFEVALEPIQIDNLGGLQSYVIGTFDGDWLILGGRLDGLHRRQPWASFSPDGNNQEIIVVSPETKQVWKQSLAALPVSIREQLSSTNMQFYQNHDRLIITGGYGYSPSLDDHITYPYLTIIDIPAVIEDVKKGIVFTENFYQYEDETFRVAGGRLSQIEDVYFLVGGHKFMGRYNPMGPDHGPGFIQEYTNEIRKFTIANDDDLAMDILPAIHDEMHLHRRDYNLGFVMSNGEKELMIYSGVFQNSADLPWLYPVKITNDGYEAKEDFTQYFNHYHCASLPIYDESLGEMHTLFFGGIAQFYMEEDILVQDNDVPFVNTIADISQSPEGELKETILDAKMPGYIGAGSEFIFSQESVKYLDGILSGESIGDDYIDVGYIYGGIRSSLPNIFWINEGAESVASSTIYKVSLRKRKLSGSAALTVKEDKVLFFPNPTQKFVNMSIEIDNPSDIQVDIYNNEGEKIHAQKILKANVNSGHNLFVLDKVNIGFGAFVYKVSFDENTITRKVIWAE